MKTKSILVGIAVFSWILTSCQPVPIPAAATATIVPPTNTLVSTNTPKPTNTPNPTSTPIPPTPTIIPPALLNEYLENVKITAIDTFDNGDGWDLTAGRITGGVLELVGKDWDGLTRNKRFKEGSGILVNFKYTMGSDFELYFDNGAWQTDSYKRFGVYLALGYAESNLWIGKNGSGNYLRGNFYPSPDTWYSLLMVVGKDGDFYALIWDPTNPANHITDRKKIEDWNSITWRFAIGANKGTILFDDFTEFTFDNIK